jgi:hypothetical protein
MWKRGRVYLSYQICALYQYKYHLVSNVICIIKSIVRIPGNEVLDIELMLISMLTFYTYAYVGE